jgi:NDP-sugar pyrophosphorylase family protein
MKAVILAAGEGTRLRPLTGVRPKPMLPVANRPLLEHVVEAVRDAGIDEVVLVVGYKRERIQSHFGDGDDWGIDIEYAVLEKQLGTGHAVLQAEEYVDGPFVALNGDRVIDPGAVERLLDEAAAAEGAVPPLVSVRRSATPTNYGVVELDGRSVASIVEKPPAHLVTTDLVNAGVYRFEPSVFEAIRATDADGEQALTATLQRLVDEETVRAVRYDGLWLDVTHLWDLPAVNARMLDRTGGRRAADAVVDGATVADGVSLGGDARVRPNATVLGGCSLGENVDVGAGAVLDNVVVLADASIGPGSVLRDCVVGESATVGPNVTVEGGYADVAVQGALHADVRLGGVVGDRAALGGGATLEPGTVLGTDSTVTTGTTVGGRVPDGTLVRRG